MNKSTLSSQLKLMLKGMAMGVAEVIPGVSGGTIAFISGIYEDLINAIKAFGPEAIQGWKDNGFYGLWDAINGGFLTFLLAGMGVGFLTGTFVITYFLDVYPEPLWGFFFGLIIASALLIGKKIGKWNAVSFILLIVGVVVAYSITALTPTVGSLNPIYVFISGAIAVSALLLPGISGSFILLLMGMYTIIIPLIKRTIETGDTGGVWTLAIFASGMAVGLVTFSRLLSWLFKHYEYQVLALLTGFLIGALNKIWPWRNPTSYMDKSSLAPVQITEDTALDLIVWEKVKILGEQNVLPESYLMGDPKVMATIISLVLGFIIIYFLEKSNLD